ncbi:Zinc finger protein 26 [Papilio xuthus]|uniref:Zinc finger protein 26 n=1 Tax=Papilio xuthus TaxID=66420 RepID=A0A0N0PAK7_PAPXU|nr:Zinc finger protein 26 [Papilio xuthus]
MIVFTEEEMLENREEKRNQPNYKKISYKCESCVLGFTRKDTFDQHMKKRHDKLLILECFTLDPTDGATIAVSPDELSEHMQSQHLVQCNQCGDKFKGKHTLRTHKIRIHGVQRNYICDICKKSFKTKSRLESHIVTHNATLASKLAFCATCNSVGGSGVKQLTYKHVLCYPVTYECMECKKKFASKVYWRKHCEFYHQRKSQYKCETCNKLFISDWRLKNHRQTQHGLTRSRNHSCNICGKKFFTQSTLRGHQLTHSEERSYMCEDCGDTFKQRPALYTHSRLVHKTRTTTMTTV